MKYLFLLFALVTISNAQIRELKGRILNSNSEPLPLANILILNTNTGTTSNEIGEFSLKSEFDNNDILLFSFIGYKSLKVSIQELNFEIINNIKLHKISFTSQTVLVEGSIGEDGVTPMAFAKVTQKEIEESYVHQDVPEYLSYLPSTTFYSESGNGIGYNYLSIRGFDQRRIAISVNGIPQNDPEDNNVYWHDMPNILSSVGIIQVQRGAGAGVIGYPAIGGSINIITSNGYSISRLVIFCLYLRYKIQGNTVVAPALPRWLRPIIKYMTLMSPTSHAMVLRTRINQLKIR